MPWFLNTLRGPGPLQWGGAVFRGLTLPGVIRYFLERTWGGKQIDEALWAYDVITTRQPGAEYAPLHFLSGGMFSADIHNTYEAIQLPVWMSHGTRGDFTDYRAKTLVESRPNWTISVFQAGAMPYFEAEEAFCRGFELFLEQGKA